MATKILVGGSQEVAQVNTHVPSNQDDGDTWSLELTDEDGHSTTLEFESTVAETVKEIVDAFTALAAAAKAGGDVPWGKVTVTDDDAILTITADTAGVPFAVVSATVGGTWTDDTPTACSGPGLYGQAENWLGGVAAEAGDDAIISNEITHRIYGYDASAVALNSFVIENGTNVPIGSRHKPLQVDLQDAKRADLGGTAETFLSIKGEGATIYVNRAAIAATDGQYGLHLETGETDMVVNVACGRNESVGIAAHDGTTMTAVTVYVVSGVVTIGEGVTITTVYAQGSEATCYCWPNLTTIYARDGAALYREGASTATNIYVQNGNAMMYERSTGLVGHVYVADAGVDCTLSTAIRDWTNTDCYDGYTIKDPHQSITHSQPITYNYCDHTAHDRGTNYNVKYEDAA